MAAWWLDDAPLTIESHERAYRLYRERADVCRRGSDGHLAHVGLSARFAASPQLGGDGSSEHSACWTASTPCRSTDG